MIRVLIPIFLCAFQLSDSLSQNTFYKQYQFALEGDNENPEFLLSVDDTIRLITTRSVSTVGLNFSLIDTNGEVISNIYHDDLYFFEEAILYDEERQEFIIDGISRREPPNKNCIIRLDKYGNLIDIAYKEYGLPDGGGLDNIFHFRKTDFGYASSGLEFHANFFHALLNLYDDEFNLTFSDTLAQFREIGNIAYDGQGGINAIGLVRNSFMYIGQLDSMFFLKIDALGNVNKQVRIPHTENLLNSNGHYPFLTDTTTGSSYLMDEYDFDTTFTSNILPRVIKFDQNGNIIWEFNLWKSSPGLNTLNIYLRKNRDLVAHGVVSFADVTNNLPVAAMQLISIDQKGSFLWDRTLYELKSVNELVERRYQFSRDITEDSQDNIYCSSLGYLNIDDGVGKKPFLTKLTQKGCFSDECEFVVNTGDYHKPNNLVTERNEIHIYNKETEQNYRYTFSSRIRDVWQTGKLLKSTAMSGDDAWEETGREVRGSGFDTGNDVSTFIRENFDFTQGIPDILSNWHYNFGYKLGDELELEHTFTNDVDFLEVVDIEEITLLDGRAKKQFTLECQNLDPDGNPYPQRIWIEDIGDINDFLNTPYACSNPGNEVITCFFSDGELIWQHPDYDFCTVNTEDVKEEKLSLFPNPTSDYLKLDIVLQSFTIQDSYGKIKVQSNSRHADETIDVSSLSSGAYILQGVMHDGTVFTQQFIKI